MGRDALDPFERTAKAERNGKGDIHFTRAHLQQTRIVVLHDAQDDFVYIGLGFVPIARVRRQDDFLALAPRCKTERTGAERLFGHRRFANLFGMGLGQDRRSPKR